MKKKKKEKAEKEVAARGSSVVEKQGEGETAVQEASTGKALEEKSGKARAKGKGVPVYFVVALVIFVFVLGIAISKVLFENPAGQGMDQNQSSGSLAQTIGLKLFFDSRCKICLRQSSLELLFKQRNLKYGLEEFDVTIKENGILAGNYGMTSFPTVLVEAKKLRIEDPQLYNLLASRFELKENLFVVPEKELMKLTMLPSSIMFMQPPVGENCGTRLGTVKLQEFSSLSQKETYISAKEIAGLKKSFGSELDYDFRHLVAQDSNSELLAVAAECARKQGAFDGFKELLLQQEFEKERDVSSIEMLKGIAATAGVKDLNAFKACVENKETLEAVREDLNASEAYGFAWVPSFVIDCIYTRVGSGDLNKALCTMHPELKACG